MKHSFRTVIAALGLLLVSGLAAAAPQHQHGQHRSEPWTAQQIELASKLPVQDGGRIKPLDTYASFVMLRLHSKRSVKTPDGEKLTPIPWLLDVLFYPEQAAQYPIFSVLDSAAIDAIKVSTADKRKRDYYSFEELSRGRDELFRLAGEYSRIDEKVRDSLQTQVVMLASNYREYEELTVQAEFARTRIPVPAGAELGQLFGGQEEASFSEVTAKLPQIAKLMSALSADPARSAELKALQELLHPMDDLLGSARLLAYLPPVGDVQTEPAWLTPAEVAMQAFEKGPAAPAHVEMLAGVERMANSLQDPVEFTKALGGVQQRAEALARSRGEFDKIGLEVTYYKLDLLYWGLVTFIFGLVLAFFLWLLPRSKVLYGLTTVAVVVPALMVTAAIVMRCMIRERPPVSTLYETVIFVTAVGSLTAVVAELINRQRIAISVAAVLGVIGLFIANGYESLDKRDTMPALVAVLDTNFWLATHVTSITIGYSAGMLAAMLASFYLIRRSLVFLGPAPDMYRSLSRMIYGVLSFGLIFSVVGTILGGVWANDSWGRFWGWDPKENGALLICLAQLVILHGRMGGYLREFGVAMATAFQGTVIAFSWFGVNLLGVGLHSYGFTQGIHNALMTYYLAQWGLMAIAFVVWIVERSNARAARESTLQTRTEGHTA